MIKDSILAIIHRPCFNDIADAWLSRVMNTHKKTTYDKYQGICRKYIFPFTEGLEYRKIKNETLKSLYIKKIEPLSLSRSSSVQSSIVTVLNQIICYTNEMYDMNLNKIRLSSPRSCQAPVEVFSRDEQKDLVRYLHENIDPTKLGVYICISTGLRLGEICALKWEDIDLSQHTISINKSVHRVNTEKESRKTKLITSSPKSKSSKRIIPISDELLSLLMKQENKEGYLLNPLKPTDPRTFENRYGKILNDIGISHKKFHVLRHTFATNCIYNGMDAKSLSEILGHSSVQITLNRYVHPSMEQKRSQLNALSALYAGSCA